MLKNKSFTITWTDLYFAVICLFPITTLLIDGGIINKAMFAFLMVLQLGLLFTHQLKAKTFLLLFFFVAHYLFVFAVTELPYANFNLLFYFPYFLMYTYFVSDNVDTVIMWLRKYEQYVMIVIVVWTVLTGISVFLPSSYFTDESGTYFGSFCGTSFRLGPSAMFIQILALVAQTMYKRKGALLLMIVPLYSVMMGESRTYAVLGLCIALIGWYFECTSKKKFWLSLLPISGLLAIFVATSSVMDKILYTLDDSNYGDFWFRLTNSRSEFWVEILEAWDKTSIIKRLLGNGFDFSLDTVGIWAHNDFLEILASFGIVGLIHYCHAIRSMIRKGSRGVKIPAILKFCAFMVWFFNAVFNMHYTYFCAMLSYPMLVIALSCCLEEHKA